MAEVFPQRHRKILLPLNVTQLKCPWNVLSPSTLDCVEDSLDPGLSDVELVNQLGHGVCQHQLSEAIEGRTTGGWVNTRQHMRWP